MSVSITENGITRDQLRKLREAQGVIFGAKRGTDTVFGSIRIIAKDGSELTLDCAATISAHTWKDDGKRRSDFTEAFEYVQSARFHREWQTIAYLIKPGDTLTLNFDADGHTNSLCDDAGLHVDAVALQVNRGEPFTKTGKVFHFHVGFRVTLDNSARMIR